MNTKTLVIALLGSCCAVSVQAQDSDAAPSLEDIRAQVCADAGVDLSKPDGDLSRSERRALQRCTNEAEKVAAEAGGAEADDGIVCRREAITGTHRRVRICTTRAERDAMRESSRDLLRDVTRPGGDFGTESQ